MLVPDVSCICAASLSWIVLNKANSHLHAMSGLNVEKIEVIEINPENIVNLPLLHSA